MALLFILLVIAVLAMLYLAAQVRGAKALIGMLVLRYSGDGAVEFSREDYRQFVDAELSVAISGTPDGTTRVRLE